MATVAEEHGATPDVCEDVKLCVHEAVLNAIQHAYPQGQGRVEIGVGCDGSELTIVVRDWGQGLGRRRADVGLGLRIIKRCTKQYVLSAAPDSGTEAVMRFDLTAREGGSCAREKRPRRQH